MNFLGRLVVVVFLAGAFDLLEVNVYVGPHVEGEKVICLRGKDVDGQR